MSEANPDLKTFLNQVESIADADGKVGMLVEYMEGALAKSGTPQFKEFWEARKRALELFKDMSNPAERSRLWARYSELSKEARRLKDLLDEESAFNVEQIDLAIQALEAECLKFSEDVEAAAPLDFSGYSKFLQDDAAFFEPRQRALNLLNAYAQRVNTLRKDLINFEMRIRQKNAFFQRLSKVGDLIFPPRKELIHEVSDKFKERVESFKARYFQKGITEPHFFLRDEIKGLQGAAKMLTLSAQAFKETRLTLSECWDNLKVEEKEVKKHRQEKKEIYKANQAELFNELKEIESKLESGEIHLHAAKSALHEFSKTMREKELGRDEVIELREALSKVNAKLDDAHDHEERERQKQAEKKESERLEKISSFHKRLEALVKEAASLEPEAIEEKRKEALEEINAFDTPKRDKLVLEKALKPLQDLIIEKKEKRLLDLPSDKLEALKQLEELKKERVLRRKEQKTLVDKLKSEAGSSGLDMVKAFELSQLLSEEKEKLEIMTQGIEELEDKIAAYR